MEVRESACHTSFPGKPSGNGQASSTVVICNQSPPPDALRFPDQDSLLENADL
jgi:hypothetical protein